MNLVDISVHLKLLFILLLMTYTSAGSVVRRACKYRKGTWSRCNLQKDRSQTLVQTLVPGSATKCEPIIVITRACVDMVDAVDPEEEKGGRGLRKERKKSRKEHRRKQKQKHKKELDKNKRKINDQKKLLHKAPPPRHLHILPHTTFADISWQPPKLSELSLDLPVDSYKIGYGQGFPELYTEKVNGTVITHRLQNLEPNTEYIVSLRAKTSMGISEALYMTIRTRSVEKVSEQVTLPPLSVRPVVLSAEAVNVSWVDVAEKRDQTLGKRKYYVRYQQMNHLSGSSSEHQYKTRSTSDMFLVVDDLLPFTKYEFSVMASDSDGRNSSWSLMVWCVTQEAAPSAPPEDLTVIQDPASPGRIVLSWQPPSKANGILTGYEVGYSTVSPGGLPSMKTRDVKGSKLSVTLTDLIPGQVYDFSVRAKNSQGLGPPLIVKQYLVSGGSARASLTLKAQPVTGDSSAVNLTWEVPKRSMKDILGFVVMYTMGMDNEDAMWKVESRVNKNIRATVVRNLRPGTRYSFRVQSEQSRFDLGLESSVVNFDTSYESVPEDELATLVTDAPRNLHLKVLSSTSAIFTWQDPGILETSVDDVGSPESTYTVHYHSLDMGAANYIVVSSPFTSLYVDDLMPFTWYEFMVKVRRGDQESPWSLPVKNRTFAADLSQRPLRAEVRGQKQSSQTAVVSWQPDPELRIQEYVILYTSDLGQTNRHWTQKAAVGPSIRQHVFESLRQGTTHFFIVQAVADLGPGPQSKILSYTTPTEDNLTWSLQQPESLQVIVMSSHSALVSWSDPEALRDEGKRKENKFTASNTYTLRYRELSEKSLGYKFTFPTLSSIFMVDLKPATGYEFSVRTDSGDRHSDWSAPVINTTFEAAPSTGPTDVMVSMDEGDPTAAILTWKPPEFSNGDITGYLVFYETTSERKSATVSGGELSYHVPFLKPQTKYFFRVGARNSQGFSPLSNRVSYRTPRVIGTPPTDVTVSPAPEDPISVIVSWQPPSPNRRKIKYYTVTHYTEDDSRRRTVLRVPGSTLTTVVKKLLPATTYHFTIQAHYQKGGGPHSAVVTYSIPKELLQNS